MQAVLLASMANNQLSLRLTDEILERAEALLPHLESDPALNAATAQVTRTTVLRYALLRGLAELEREQQETSPAAVPRGKTAPRRR